MDALRALDARLFHRVNAVWTAPFLDAVLPALTDAHKAWPVWLAAAAAAGYWIYRGRRRAAETLAALGLTVGATDLLAYRVVKQLVRRPRPEHSGIPVILRAGSHGLYGFPSNHAANCFAAAVFLGSLYPRWLAPLLLAAGVVGYSRVYVGAHFPLDVAGGALLGTAIGRAAALFFRKFGFADGVAKAAERSHLSALEKRG